MKELVLSLMCLLVLVTADPKCSCRTKDIDENNWPFGDRFVEKWNHVTIGQENTGNCSELANILIEKVSSSKIVDPLDHCGKQLTETKVRQLWINNSGFGQLLVNPNVAVLRISDTNFTELVIKKSQIYKTQRIYIKNVPLITHPKNLNSLQNLVSFVAKEIPLKFLDLDQFNGLSKLQSITVSNSLTSIAIGPTDLDLPALISLNVHSNQILTIPHKISSLKSLEMLNFCFNRISYLDLSVFNGLDLLRDLKISHNPLHVINSPTVVNLPNLNHLHLQHTYLERLDVASWHVPKLRTVNLNWNNLTRVENLEGGFPRETVVHAEGNTWSCAWLKQALKWVQIQQSQKARCGGN